MMAMLLYICNPIIKRSSSPTIAFPSLFYLENEKCTIFSHYMNRWTPLLLAWFRKIRKHLRPSVAAARELYILWLTCRKNWRLISRKEHTVVCLQNPLTAISYLLGIIWEVWSYQKKAYTQIHPLDIFVILKRDLLRERRFKLKNWAVTVKKTPKGCNFKKPTVLLVILHFYCSWQDYSACFMGNLPIPSASI